MLDEINEMYELLFAFLNNYIIYSKMLKYPPISLIPKNTLFSDCESETARELFSKYMSEGGIFHVVTKGGYKHVILRINSQDVFGKEEPLFRIFSIHSVWSFERKRDKIKEKIDVEHYPVLFHSDIYPSYIEIEVHPCFTLTFELQEFLEEGFFHPSYSIVFDIPAKETDWMIVLARLLTLLYNKENFMKLLEYLMERIRESRENILKRESISTDFLPIRLHDELYSAVESLYSLIPLLEEVIEEI